MNRYRLNSLVLSFALLGCAFGAKYYTGPAEQLAHRYLADFFIVAWLYFCLSVAASRLRPLPKGGLIFAVASAVELFQATGIPGSPGFSRVIIFWIGNTFDPWDFAPYFLGTLLAATVDAALRRRAIHYKRLKQHPNCSCREDV